MTTPTTDLQVAADTILRLIEIGNKPVWQIMSVDEDFWKNHPLTPIGTGMVSRDQALVAFRDWLLVLDAHLETQRTNTEYPLTVAAISVASYEDAGCQYTLTFSDGKVVKLGDAEDNYGVLANVLDDEYAKDGETEKRVRPREAIVWIIEEVYPAERTTDLLAVVADIDAAHEWKRTPSEDHPEWKPVFDEDYFRTTPKADGTYLTLTPRDVTTAKNPRGTA